MTNPFTDGSEAKRAEAAQSIGDKTNIVGHGRFRFLESIEDALFANHLATLKDQLRVAVRYFPRLWDHTITVGVTEKHDERGDTVACAEKRNYMVKFKPSHRPSNSTVFHELAHLEIAERDRNGADLPTSSEPFYDLYAVARMPPGLLYENDELYYVGQPGVPRDDWPEHCRAALAYRDERGANSHYIQRARELLEVNGGAGT